MNTKWKIDLESDKNIFGRLRPVITFPCYEAFFNKMLNVWVATHLAWKGILGTSVLLCKDITNAKETVVNFQYVDIVSMQAHQHAKMSDSRMRSQVYVVFRDEAFSVVELSRVPVWIVLHVGDLGVKKHTTSQL